MAMLNRLVPLVNKLQEVLATVGRDKLDLPQIVVVGSQSAGKSSVLESIVGRSFLPRGTGIVTRRPLILQLVYRKVREEDQDVREYGEFGHHPGRLFYDFEEIRREIISDTERIAGPGKIISNQPILLRIFSDRVVDLTLVDLPGLTKIPVGEQPENIEAEIRSLVMDFILKPSALILAVSPGNQDIANSDSLRIAREVDPAGARTLGVLTKLDLADASTNAAEILLGKTYPLRLGFIGVVNKAFDQELNTGSMERRRELETEFFRSHPQYRALAHRCGHEYLSETLNRVLMIHIKEKLPELKARINMLIAQNQQQLVRLGETQPELGQHKESLMLRLLTKYANDFGAVVEGKNADISTRELCGGARIYYIFNDIFRSALDTISPAGNLTITEIRTAIRNSTGARPSLFIPETAFDLLIKPQIGRLRLPATRCVELVFDELLKIAHECSTKDLKRYPRLQHRVVQVVVDLLKERLVPTTEYVDSLVLIQQAYINTNHPDFVAAKDAFFDVERTGKEERARTSRKNCGKKHQPPEHSLPPVAEAEKVQNSVQEEDSVSSPRTHALGNTQALREIPQKIPQDKPKLADPGSVGSLNSANGSARSVGDVAARGGGATSPPESDSQREGFLSYFFGGYSSSSKVRQNPVSPLGPSPLSRQLAENNDGQLNLQIREEEIEDLFRPPVPISGKEEWETRLIRSFITSYFNIVRRSMQDMVPKAVMYHLVNYSRDSLQTRLVEKLYKAESSISDLLAEDPGIKEERDKCRSMLEAYKRAASLISDAC